MTKERSIQELKQELEEREREILEDIERKKLEKRLKQIKFQNTKFGRVATDVFNIAEKVTRPKPKIKGKKLKSKKKNKGSAFDLNKLLRDLPQ